MEAIEELHYVPNFNARNFVRKRTNILGALILSPDTGRRNYEFDRESGIYPQNVIDGIIEQLSGTDYGLITELYDQKSGRLPQMVRDSRVDGIFVIGSLHCGLDLHMITGERNIPVVLLGSMRPDCDSFMVDIVDSVRIAVNYLLEKGHSRIGLINCSPTFSSSMGRVQGYESALRDAGIEPDPNYVVYGESNTGLSGMRAVEELFRRADGRIDIMAGCGVKKWNIQEIHDRTGIAVFHTTGRKGVIDSGMRYRKQTVAMGLPSLSEYELWQTDEEEFRACAQIVHGLAQGAQA